MKHFAIAIDGPSGAGKSTLAKRIAERLGILYVDTGAIYRTVGLYIRRVGVEPTDKEKVTARLSEIHIDLRFLTDGQHLLLNGEDVSQEIRLPEISLYASAVSAHGTVRDFLMEQQRSLAREHCVIMDGRDIGTVVLPQAELKIFLTADVEERARRREKELSERGTPQPFADILAEMKMRDYNDSHRAVAPLTRAEDAVLFDTTHMDFSESEAALLRLIEERLEVRPCK